MNTIYNMEPPRLSKSQIENTSEKLLQKYTPYVFEEAQPTPITMLIEKYLGIDLDYKYLSVDKSILGTISFSDGIIDVYDDNRRNKYKIQVERGTILIENDLMTDNNIGRGRFTMAHETGHWILHRDVCDHMFRCENKPRKLETNNDWFEWQADTFSSSILMPKNMFVKEFYQIMKTTEASKGNREFIEFAAECLSELFQVSFQAAMVRIKKLNIV